MDIRRATPEDLPQLVELEKSCFPRPLEPEISQEYNNRR